jgi:hypothetical protein
MFKFRVLTAVTICLVGASAAEATPQAVNRLVATVKPCAITYHGKVATSVPPGRYALVIRDRSRKLYFQFNGPRVAKATTARFVGTRTWSVVLHRGTYRFSCFLAVRHTLLVR